MQKKQIKKILGYINATLLISFIISIFVCIHLFKDDYITRKIIQEKPLTFSLVLYGTEKAMPERLDAFLITYERETDLLKVLYVNSDAVVFRKKARARSFKYSFFEQSQKDINLAFTNFYEDLFEMLENNVQPDFYINMSYETFFKIFNRNKEIKKLSLNTEFENRDIDCLHKHELFEAIIRSLNKQGIANINRMIKYYNKVDTNLSKKSILSLLLHFRINTNTLMFCDMPVKYTKTRVEPDKANIVSFIREVYNRETILKYDTTSKVLAEVFNASRKPRMAEKATWLLRENRIDVIDWKNYDIAYDKTIIKDNKGFFADAIKIKEALKTGKIIVSYNSKTYCDISVFVGKDCEIYDKLDKKNNKEVKNGEN